MRMLDQRNAGRGRSLAVWATGIALSLGAGSALAADGDLVADFGDDGVVTVGYEGTPLDSYQAAAVQADSSILAAGVTFFGVRGSSDPEESSDLLIGRFNANGSPLGADLIADAINGRLTGVGVSPAGEIVVVGFNDNNPSAAQVRKFSATGTAGGSFAPPSTPGVTVQCQGSNVVFDTGGKIVVPCTVVLSDVQAFPAVARFNSDLSPDTSFGSDADGAGSGTARTGFALGSSPNTAFEGFPRGSVVASDGSGGYYLLVTNSDTGVGDIDPSIYVQHFLAGGTLDTAYGGDGRAEVTSTTGSNYSSVNGDSLFLDSSGELVVGGSRFGLAPSAEGPGAVGLVARLNTNGTLDTGFGTAGLVDPLVDNIAGGFSAIALFGDSANRLYVLNSKLLTRLSANGAIDATFDREPSNLAIITGVREENSKYGGAVVVDGGASALLLGGVDQFLVALGIDDSTALATIAKIDLGADPGPTPDAEVNFAATGIAVGESRGTVRVNVSLSPASTVDVTVPFTFGGNARPADYTLPNGSSIVIPAGETSGSLDVLVVDDTLDEKAEILNIALGTPTNATVGSRNAFALRINDNDEPPVVRFDVPTSFVPEGGQRAVLVRLTAASSQIVTVSFTVSGSAAANDYILPTGRTVVFNPGKRVKNIVIGAVDDTRKEGKETVVLTLQDAENAGIGGAGAVRTVTILDND